ncbi:putative helix-loop-helix DNA-binding domain protein [Trichinella spiralis]|uniref:putative helix-loop-helix DNA-binding domain protein n=1 Tax=Trichinella spiralis TaxID=6334 RepID=UPI0001EFB226|nr:putative helix-loop-helix DNA-binding domain protein [Trichinella spiralis]
MVSGESISSSSDVSCTSPAFTDQSAEDTLQSSNESYTPPHPTSTTEIGYLPTNTCYPPTDDFDNGAYTNRQSRDLLSHRIIEKRRRDRMNNCLTNLSKLIPTTYLRKSRGRVEKTEIVEMAIRYIKHFKQNNLRETSVETIFSLPKIFLRCKLRVSVQGRAARRKVVQQCRVMSLVGRKKDGHSKVDQCVSTDSHKQLEQSKQQFERYKQGFYDCIAETLRLLIGADGLTVNDQLKSRLLKSLCQYFEHVTNRESEDQYDKWNVDNGKLKWNEQDFNRKPVASYADPLCAEIIDSFKPNRSHSSALLNHILPYHFKCDSNRNFEAAFSSDPLRTVNYPNCERTVLQNSTASSMSSYQIPNRSLASNERIISVGGPNLPAFVLHPSGMFYLATNIKLAYLDRDVIGRFMRADTSAEGRASALAFSHPVAINVSFSNA